MWISNLLALNMQCSEVITFSDWYSFWWSHIWNIVSRLHDRLQTHNFSVPVILLTELQWEDIYIMY